MLDLPKYHLEDTILPANTAKLAGTVMLNLFQHLSQTLNPPEADRGDALIELSRIFKTIRNFG